MTRIIITLLISILSLLVNAQETKIELPTNEEGVTISVTVPKITSNKGKVYFALFNSEENFDEKIKFQEATGEIIDNKTEISFENVPAGLYAITCYHDSNDNMKMDFYGFIPAEDYGVSNNPKSFGPPKFDSSKFVVENTDLNLEIKF